MGNERGRQVSQALAERARSEIARPLKVLVPLIKEELDAGNQAGLGHYRRAGEMLLEAKEQVEHGEWKAWVERNFDLSYATAARYMSFAKVSEKKPTATFGSLQQAIRSHESRSSSWHEPVKEIAARVNVEALARERQDKEKEERLMRQLAHQLIDIGYRVLSAKLHPDKAGGSSEAMSRLNNVRRILKEAI